MISKKGFSKYHPRDKFICVNEDQSTRSQWKNENWDAVKYAIKNATKNCTQWRKLRTVSHGWKQTKNLKHDQYEK